MAVYQMGSHNPYNKPFRISFAIAIILLLAALWFSFEAPQSVTDHARTLIAEIAVGVLIAAIIIGLQFMSSQSRWMVAKGYHLEISEGNLIQSRAGSPVCEIPLSQIVSLTESRGRWLIVRGNQSGQRIAISHDIQDFENLTREIIVNVAGPAQQTKLSPWLFLPSATLSLSLAFLIFSHDPRVIIAAGVAGLILQAASIYSLSRLRKHPKFPFVLAICTLELFLIAFVLYFCG